MKAPTQAVTLSFQGLLKPTLVSRWTAGPSTVAATLMVEMMGILSDHSNPIADLE